MAVNFKLDTIDDFLVCFLMVSSFVLLSFFCLDGVTMDDGVPDNSCTKTPLLERPFNFSCGTTGSP